MRKMKKILAGTMAAGMLFGAVPAMAETVTIGAGTANVAQEAAAAEDVALEAAEVAVEAEETAGAVADAQEIASEQADAAAAQEAAESSQRLDAVYTLALNAINREDYATARKYLNVAFVYCDPQSNPVLYADLLLKQACIDVIEEEYSIALLELEAALAIQPDLADAYLVQTQVYTTEGDLNNAVVSLEKYIALTGDTTLYETLAQLHEANGDAAAAQDAYDQFVAASGEGNLEAAFQAALYRLNNGKYEEAAEAFAALADDETYGAAAQYNIGISRMNMGDFAGAVEAFTASEEKGGLFSGLYFNRGTCYLMGEDWAKAADDFAKSIETEPLTADARYNLGLCRMQLGEYEEAVAAFDELAQAAEADSEATLNDAVYYFRAVCNAALGNLDAAVQDLTTCIDHGYELEQAYYQRAEVYAAMGDTEKQSSDLENALKYAQ